MGLLVQCYSVVRGYAFHEKWTGMMFALCWHTAWHIENAEWMNKWWMNDFFSALVSLPLLCLFPQPDSQVWLRKVPDKLIQYWSPRASLPGSQVWLCGKSLSKNTCTLLCKWWIDTITTICTLKENRLHLQSVETETQWAQGLVMEFSGGSELPQTNLLKFCQVWGCYAWEPGLPSLTTGTCSVAANIHFPFSPRHPLQLVCLLSSLLPHIRLRLQPVV